MQESLLLQGLAEKGFGHEQLAEMQRIIDAEKSDLFDVLAYVAYALGSKWGSKPMRVFSDGLKHRGSLRQVDMRNASKPASGESSGETRQVISVKDMMHRGREDSRVKRDVRVRVVVDLKAVFPSLPVSLAVHGHSDTLRLSAISVWYVASTLPNHTHAG